MKKKTLICFWAVLVIGMALLIIYSALVENSSKITHIVNLDHTDRFSYLKVELRKLEPREPLVDTRILIFTDDPNQISNKAVTLIVAGKRGYGDHIIPLPGASFGGGISFEDKAANIPLFPLKGSHAWFPFDNLYFDSSIVVDPSLPLKEIEIVNRVDGFIISGVPEVKRDGKEITIRFHLNRNMFLRVFSVILAISTAIFLFLILKLKPIEELALSAASFLISLWSIRGIIAQGLQTFPSLLDFWILSMFVVLLMGILLKLILQYTSREPMSNRSSQN